MLSRVGLAISRVFERTAPDPFVLAVLLTLLAALLVLLFGDFSGAAAGAAALPFGDRIIALLDSWRGTGGLWRFLGFAMQMCLILVTGYALAESRPVRRALALISDRPKSTASAAALVGFVAAGAGVINWGLGLIVGAVLARDVGRSLRRRGVPAHYPLICAAGYMGLLVWHGGLSGSAPLKATTGQQLADTFSAERVAALGLEGGIPLDRTLASPLNFAVTGALLVVIPLMLFLLAPKQPQQMRTIDEFEPPVPPEPAPSERAASIPERLERSPIISGVLAVALLLAMARYAYVSGLASLTPDQINAAMFGLGLLLHGSLRSYAAAAERGARACAGIIVQFPLYAGILGMMEGAGLTAKIASFFVEHGSAETIPLFTFISAAVVNLFVPSGGGQWGIQGLIALESGAAAGVEPGRMVMAVAYGDELTNMLQPFWALPLLGITGVRARDIVGYTVAVMVVAGAIMAIGLVVL